MASKKTKEELDEYIKMAAQMDADAEAIKKQREEERNKITSYSVMSTDKETGKQTVQTYTGEDAAIAKKEADARKKKYGGNTDLTDLVTEENKKKATKSSETVSVKSTTSKNTTVKDSKKDSTKTVAKDSAKDRKAAKAEAIFMEGDASGKSTGTAIKNYTEAMGNFIAEESKKEHAKAKADEAYYGKYENIEPLVVEAENKVKAEQAAAYKDADMIGSQTIKQLEAYEKYLEKRRKENEALAEKEAKKQAEEQARAYKEYDQSLQAVRDYESRITPYISPSRQRQLEQEQNYQKNEGISDVVHAPSSLTPAQKTRNAIGQSIADKSVSLLNQALQKPTGNETTEELIEQLAVNRLATAGSVGYKGAKAIIEYWNARGEEPTNAIDKFFYDNAKKVLENYGYIDTMSENADIAKKELYDRADSLPSSVYSLSPAQETRFGIGENIANAALLGESDYKREEQRISAKDVAKRAVDALDQAAIQGSYFLLTAPVAPFANSIVDSRLAVVNGEKIGSLVKNVPEGSTIIKEVFNKSNKAVNLAGVASTRAAELFGSRAAWMGLGNGLEKYTGLLQNGVQPDEAAARSITSGVITWLTESAGGIAGDKYSPIGQLMTNVGDKFTTNIVAKTSIYEVIKSISDSGLYRLLSDCVEEGNEEVAEYVLDWIADGLYDAVYDNNLQSDFDINEAIENWKSAAFDTIFMSGANIAAQTAIEKVDNNQTEKAIKEIVDTAKLYAAAEIKKQELQQANNAQTVQPVVPPVVQDAQTQQPPIQPVPVPDAQTVQQPTEAKENNQGAVGSKNQKFIDGVLASDMSTEDKIDALTKELDAHPRRKAEAKQAFQNAIDNLMADLHKGQNAVESPTTDIPVEAQNDTAETEKAVTEPPTAAQEQKTEEQTMQEQITPQKEPSKQKTPVTELIQRVGVPSGGGIDGAVFENFKNIINDETLTDQEKADALRAFAAKNKNSVRAVEQARRYFQFLRKKLGDDYIQGRKAKTQEQTMREQLVPKKETADDRRLLLEAEQLSEEDRVNEVNERRAAEKNTDEEEDRETYTKELVETAANYVDNEGETAERGEKKPEKPKKEKDEDTGESYAKAREKSAAIMKAINESGLSDREKERLIWYETVYGPKKASGEALTDEEQKTKAHYAIDLGLDLDKNWAKLKAKFEEEGGSLDDLVKTETTVTKTKKELAHPELADVRKNIFDGKVYSLEELEAFPQTKEAEKRANLDSNETSDKKFTDKDGNYSAERKAVHKKIVDEIEALGSAQRGEDGKLIVDSEGNVIYNGVVERGFHADIVIGPPAAGKSSVFADPLSVDHKARIIDSDTVKSKLPEFDEGFGANFIHVESSKIASTTLTNDALEKGENVVFPLVGGKLGKIKNLISRLRDKGYTVNLYYNELSAEKALNRAYGRFISDGRFVPLKYIANIYSDKDNNPTKTYYDLLKEGVADYYEHRNNDVRYGDEPTLVENPTGRDLYRPGERNEVQYEGRVRQSGSDGRGSVEAGDAGVQNRVKEAGAQKSTGSFNAQNEPKRNPEDPNTTGAMEKAPVETVTGAVSSFGVQGMKEEPYNDIDAYAHSGEAPKNARYNLNNSKMEINGEEMSGGEGVIQLVRDGAEFKTRKTKSGNGVVYYAEYTDQNVNPQYKVDKKGNFILDKDGNKIPVSYGLSDEKATVTLTETQYKFAQYLQRNGVKYWANKATQAPKQVVTEDGDVKNVSKIVPTLYGSQLGTDENIKTIEDRLNKGGFSYFVKKNRQTLNEELDNIKMNGWSGVQNQWDDFVRNEKKFTPNRVAQAILLAEHYTELGNSGKAVEVMMELQAEATVAGQGIQFIATLTSKGRDKDVEGMFNLDKTSAEYFFAKLQEAANKAYKDKLKGKKIKISDDILADAIAAFDTPAENEAIEKVYVNMANQIPASALDKINAWRYFCMLSGTRTHARNVVGNILSQSHTKLANMYSSVVENSVNRKTGRTAQDKAFSGKLFLSPELKKAGREDFGTADAIFGMANNKNASITSIEGRRTNTNSGDGKTLLQKTVGKALDGLESTVTKALNKEDEIAKREIYASVFAQMISANGWKLDTMTPDQLGFVREKAIAQAYKTTFNNQNKAVQALNQAIDNIKDRKVRAVVKTLVNIELPFQKVPANIAARIVEASPVGLAYNVTKLGNKLKENPNADVYEEIESVGRGLAGSTISMAGAILGALGYITLGSGDEDKDKIMENSGWQNFSIKIGDSYYAIDDLGPVSNLLLSGAVGWDAVKKVLSGNIDEFTAGKALAAFLEITTSAIEPYMELDMIRTFKDLFTNYNGDDDTVALVLGKVEKMLVSYAGQYEPNIMRQFTKVLADENRNSYYYDKNDETPKWIQNIRDNAKAIFKSGYDTLPAKYDLWGRSTAEDNWLQRGLDYLIDPAKRSSEKMTDVDKFLLDSYEETGVKDLFPKEAAKYFNVDGKRVDLTGQQYSQYQKELGTKRYDMMEQLIADDDFKKLSAEDKQKVISSMYEYSNAFAKSKVSSYSYESNWLANMEVAEDKYKIDKTDFLIARTQLNRFKTEKSNGETDETGNKRFYEYLADNKSLDAEQKTYLVQSLAQTKAFDNLADAEKQGISDKDYVNAYNFYQYDYEQGTDVSRDDQFADFLNKQKSLTAEQKQYLYEAIGGGTNFVPVERKTGLDFSSSEALEMSQELSEKTYSDYQKYYGEKEGYRIYSVASGVESSKKDDIVVAIAEEYQISDVAAEAKYNLGYANKRYDGKEYTGFSEKQINYVKDLESAGWTPDEITKAAKAVTGVGKKNAYEALVSVGFTSAEARSFLSMYKVS